jgi:hypothetical protein
MRTSKPTYLIFLLLSFFESFYCNEKKCSQISETHYIIQGCGYEIIELGTEEQRQTLKYVNALKNNVTHIDDEMFEFAENLIEINMKENKIGIMNIAAFKDQKNLENLFLKENELTRINPGVFDSLSELYELWLQNNKILILENHIFKNNKKLKILYLDNNKIITIGMKVFNQLIEAEITIHNNICVSENDAKMIITANEQKLMYVDSCPIISSIKHISFIDHKCTSNYDKTEIYFTKHYITHYNVWQVYVIVLETLLIIFGLLYHFKDNISNLDFSHKNIKPQTNTITPIEIGNPVVQDSTYDVKIDVKEIPTDVYAEVKKNSP